MLWQDNGLRLPKEKQSVASRRHLSNGSNKDILAGRVKPTSDAAGFLYTLSMYGGEQWKK